jgi:peptidoglycan-associated lipoprotein
MSSNRVNRVFGLCFVALCGVLITGCPKKQTTPVETPVETPEAEMEILRVTPNQGRSDQATPVTISGRKLPQGARVVVGDTVTTDTTVVSPTEIRTTIPSGLAPGSYDVVVSNPDPAATRKEARLRGGFISIAPPPSPAPKPSDCQLSNIFFDFDMSTLSDASRSTLQKDAECLKGRFAKKVEVQGHTDERGSTDYNLALGQRRADEVKRYLGTLGIDNVTTISYGEERPAIDGHDESAWSQNRRAEIHILE